MNTEMNVCGRHTQTNTHTYTHTEDKVASQQHLNTLNPSQDMRPIARTDDWSLVEQAMWKTSAKDTAEVMRETCRITQWK